MRSSFWPAALLIAAYLAIGALFAVYTPAWQAPDEPAHYNYVRQLVDGRLPVIEVGDYDQAYQAAVIGSRFDPQYSIEPFRYEDWQPPLYYLLLAPVFALTGGALLPLRLVSVLLGAGVVILTYATVRRLWASRPHLALTAAAFVAFLPQHVAILASVNNDSLAELLIAATLFLLASRLSIRDEGQPDNGRALLPLGVLLGLGFLTKGTAYLLAPMLALFLLWESGWRLTAVMRPALIVFVPALLIGALWWGRNIVVYPGLDPLALTAHDTVVTGQPRTSEWLVEYGAVETAVRFGRTTFNSFWGQFGWMGVPMPGWVYQILLLFSVLALGGLIVAWLRGRRPGPGGRLLLLPLLLLSVSLYLSYNVTFVQHQGRYLFPALIPIAVGVAFGWQALLAPLFRRRPELNRVLPLGLAAGLLALDVVALFRFIIPNLR